VRVPPDDPSVVTRTRALATVVTGGALLALLGLGVATEFGPQMTLDAELSEAVYSGDGRAALLDGLLEVLTAPGLSVFRVAVFLPVVVWLLARRAYRTVLWVLVAILLIAPVTELLKNTFDRVRPDFDDGGARYESLSYPSGHSSGIATLVTVALVVAWPLLAPHARRWWLGVGVALVVLVGLTRMWLGVHYLSDVVGGWSLGVAWSLGLALLAGGLPGGRAALRPGDRERVP
jgi:membrane-associated phospholipid phosphatase